METDCGNCGGTGVCPTCLDDGAACSWCADGSCADCGGSGAFICEEVYE